MTINDFYYQSIIPIFKDKLMGYLLDRFNAKIGVSFSDSSFGSVFFSIDGTLSNFLNFYFLNNHHLKVYSRDSSDFSFIECQLVTVPNTFWGSSNLSNSCFRDLKFTYLVDKDISSSYQQKEDFFDFFISSLGLKEDYKEYADTLLGEEVF